MGGAISTLAKIPQRTPSKKREWEGLLFPPLVKQHACADSDDVPPIVSVAPTWQVPRLDNDDDVCNVLDCAEPGEVSETRIDV
jgi:hypothetical protein